MPNVVALVGPCKRIKKSGSLIKPIEPIKINVPPNNNNIDTTHSLIMFSPYSIISPRSKYLHTATVLIKPSMAMSSAASK